MLWLVVLGGEGPLVQGVLGRVGLGRRLDVHEGHRRGGALAGQTAGAARAGFAARVAARTVAPGALLAPRK